MRTELSLVATNHIRNCTAPGGLRSFTIWPVDRWDRMLPFALDERRCALLMNEVRSKGYRQIPVASASADWQSKTCRSARETHRGPVRCGSLPVNITGERHVLPKLDLCTWTFIVISAADNDRGRSGA